MYYKAFDGNFHAKAFSESLWKIQRFARKEGLYVSSICEYEAIKLARMGVTEFITNKQAASSGRLIDWIGY